MARALIVSILGDAKQFGAELDKAAGKTRSMGKAAGVAGLAIAGGLAYGMEKSVKAAMAAQEGTARLDAAFRAAGLGSTDYAGAIDKAETSARNLGFSNIDARDSLGSLVAATHNTKTAVADLTSAENLARFKHMSLTDATKVMTSAMAGSNRAARQLGISVASSKDHSTAAAIAYKHQTDAIKAQFPPTAKMTVEQKRQETALLDAAKATHASVAAHASLADKMETSASVTEKVNKLTEGQGKAFAGTAAGGMAKFHAQTEFLQETLGNMLLPVITKVTSKLADMAGWLGKHSTVAKILVGVLAGLAVVLGIVSVATTIWGIVTAAAFLPIIAVIAALALLGAAIYEIVKHWGAISAFFSGVWDKIKGVFTAGIDFVKSHWRDFVMALATIIAGPLGLLVSYIATHWGRIKADTIQAWNAIKDFLRGIWNTLGNLAGNIWDGVKSAWATAWSALKNAVMGPINTIISWVNKLLGPIETAIHLLEKLGGMGGSGGPASSGGTKPGQPRGPVGGRGASGGIVTQATWALIGEGGPEALIPLNRMPGASPLGRGGGGGGVTVIVNGWVGSDQQLAQRLRNELVALGRREPNIFAGYA